MASSHKPPAPLRQAPGATPSRVGSKQKGPAEQVAPRVSSLKICRFWVCIFPINPWRKYDSQRPLFGGDFLGQILAADSLPGAFVHSLQEERISSRFRVDFWPKLAENERRRAKTAKNSTPTSTFKGGVCPERWGGVCGWMVKSQLYNIVEVGIAKWPLVASSTSWMLHYLCFTPSTAIGPHLQ